MESAYNVRAGSFQGPLELLLALIEKRKLFINEISLAQVTEDYLSYVKSLGHFPLGNIANFIIVAATLILIKSRSLLPELSLTEEEEGSIADLESRLNLYKIVSAASVKLKEMLSGPFIMERPFSRARKPIFTPDPSFTAENFNQAVKTIIANLPKKEKLQEITVKKVISIEEMIESITERIGKEIRTSFSRISGYGGGTGDREERVRVIVGFLAMLELVKQGLIAVSQENRFGDINIEAGAAS